MKKIILCPNPDRDLNLEYSRKIYDILIKKGIETYFCPVFYDDFDRMPEPDDLKFFEIEHVLDSADLAVVFGGDGTILRVAKSLSTAGVPLLGVNLGQKGFMAELERSEIDEILRVLDGDYKTEKRIMLDYSVKRQGETVCFGSALNDAVVHGIGRTLDLTVLVDGVKVLSFVGDGVVIATPTGSTGYSLSAGGPIVEPTVENLIVTPICAHILAAKPYIIGPDSAVNIRLGHLGSKSAYISADGGALFSLKDNDILEVRRSENVTSLVKLTKKSFYEKVSDKLGETK